LITDRDRIIKHIGGYKINMGFNNFNGPRNNFGPREMHKAICSKCKKECEVPFKPTEGKPIYCKECYADMPKPKRF